MLHWKPADRVIKAILMFVFILCICGAGIAFLGAGAQTHSNKTRHIKWIIDGDTFELEDLERVRLLGIDAPESKKNQKLKRLVASEARNRDSIIQLGKQSTKYCIEQFKGKKVTLVRDGIQPDRDEYGRLLRYLILEDGTCINILLILEGMAIVYEHADFSKRDEFIAAQETAKRQEKGIWAKNRIP